MREWPIMSVTKIQNLIYASLPNTGNGMEHLWCFASWSLWYCHKNQQKHVLI